MSTLVILAAGKSSRLQGLYKPNLVVGGKRMIDWQMTAAQTEYTVVVAHDSQVFPETKWNVKTTYTRKQWGPASALCQGLNFVLEEPVVVALADTWWRHTPGGSDWVGVSPAQGGRSWDYPQGTSFTRSFVPANHRLDVCVGLYSFSDIPALKSAVNLALDHRAKDREVSMAEVLHFYELPLRCEQIPEWLDVGDPESWRAADSHLRSVV